MGLNNKHLDIYQQGSNKADVKLYKQDYSLYPGCNLLLLMASMLLIASGPIQKDLGYKDLITMKTSYPKEKITHIYYPSNESQVLKQLR